MFGGEWVYGVLFPFLRNKYKIEGDAVNSFAACVCLFVCVCRAPVCVVCVCVCVCVCDGQRSET